jgi:hypothetical protein
MTITLTQCLSDPDLFGTVFGDPSFWTWKVVAKLIDGLPLTEPREIDLFEQCTGLKYRKYGAVRRLIVLAGRRAGKDRFESAVAVWRAALSMDWRQHQSAGEGAVVILLGADKKQAAILRKYCHGLLQTPLLKAEVTRSTGDVTEFRNGSSLEIATNDARLVRGRSAIAVLGSECCHWRTDEHSASSDEEVVGAAEPSMAMCPDGGLLMLASSVYRQKGYMFRRYRELFGNEEASTDTICWFAPTPLMNPKFKQRVLDRALAENPSKARAEYLNVWRTDLEEFLPLDVVEACTDWGVYERAPQPNTRYYAYGDSAGGTGKDSYALAIAHIGPDGEIVIDAIREWKPRFVPKQVIAEIVELVKTYGITEVYGDNFGGGLHQEDWRGLPVAYRAWKDTTSENYLAALSSWLAKGVRLVDNMTARNQLTSLERRPGAGDKESVDHPKHAGAHDDVAASICGAIVLAQHAARIAAQQPKIVVPVVVSGGARYIPGSDTYTGTGVPATPSAPAASYDYNKERGWRNFVNSDGSIRGTRRNPWDI